ncbi:MAG: sulfur transferase domain-containing protein, partial [candidate division KSB1 bacterium]
MIIASASFAQERENLATLEAALQTEVPRFLCLNENIATGAQPKAEAFAKLAQQGYRAVLSLRVEKEEGFDLSQDRARAEQAGLRYIHIPFATAAPDTQRMAQFFAAVKEKKNFPMLVYCGSANRV